MALNQLIRTYALFALFNNSPPPNRTRHLRAARVCEPPEPAGREKRLQVRRMERAGGATRRMAHRRPPCLPPPAPAARTRPDSKTSARRHRRQTPASRSSLPPTQSSLGHAHSPPRHVTEHQHQYLATSFRLLAVTSWSLDGAYLVFAAALLPVVSGDTVSSHLRIPQPVYPRLQLLRKPPRNAQPERAQRTKAVDETSSLLPDRRSAYKPLLPQ